MDAQQSIGESNAEHKHIWPRNGGGCWCGATQCSYMVPREKKTVAPEGRTPLSGYKSAAVANAAPLSDRCKEAAALPSPYCAIHIVSSQ
jgi:hypothetical protein